MKTEEKIEVCGCVHKHEHIQKKRIPKKETLYSLAELFKVFSDPTRIRILYALSAGELCVCDIASVLDMSQSAISHQPSCPKTDPSGKIPKRGENGLLFSGRFPRRNDSQSGVGTRSGVALFISNSISPMHLRMRC